MHKTRNGLMILCGVAALLLLGCQQDEVRSYRVPKPEATRLLAVIIPHGDRTWFFKLMGPASQIDEQKGTFDQFVRSVRFTDRADAPITWTVPKYLRVWWLLDGTNWTLVPEAASPIAAPGQPLSIAIQGFRSGTGTVKATFTWWAVLNPSTSPLLILCSRAAAPKTPS